jgi:hypothetical protein
VSETSVWASKKNFFKNLTTFLELPVEGRYPKRNNPDPEREPDAVITRHCEICHIWCTGTESWQAHTNGKEHKRNRKKAQQNCPVSSKAPPPVYHCEICDVECIGDGPWQAHNNGIAAKNIFVWFSITNALE